MKTKIFLVIIISLLVFAGQPFNAQAAPLINSTIGSFIHGQNITISGSEFGTKNPAAPLLWDDGTSNPPLNTYYDEVLPTSAQQGSYYNMAYRAVPFRGVNGPTSRVSYILGGAHSTNSNAGMYSSGNNVSIGKNLTSFQFFSQYWYRVDPLYDEVCSGIGEGSDCPNAVSLNNPPSENMKEISLSGAAGQIYGGHWGYFNWCGSHVPDVNFHNPVRISRSGADCPSLPYSCSTDSYVVTHNNPANGWIKMQWEGDYNTTFDNPTVKFTTYPDGHVTEKDHYGNPLTTYETLWGCGFPEADSIRFLGLGGFSRVPRQNNGNNAFRYFAGVYIDSTRARVVLTDNQDYTLATKVEPQIPSGWDDGSITAAINLGALPDSGTAYLFVFDANNNHNAVGYPVTLGSGSDTTPPEPPTGIVVN